MLMNVPQPERTNSAIMESNDFKSCRDTKPDHICSHLHHLSAEDASRAALIQNQAGAPRPILLFAEKEKIFLSFGCYVNGSSLILILAVSEMDVSVENTADTDNEDLGCV